MRGAFEDQGGLVSQPRTASERAPRPPHTNQHGSTAATHTPLPERGQKRLGDSNL